MQDDDMQTGKDVTRGEPRGEAVDSITKYMVLGIGLLAIIYFAWVFVIKPSFIDKTEYYKEDTQAIAKRDVSPGLVIDIDREPESDRPKSMVEVKPPMSDYDREVLAKLRETKAKLSEEYAKELAAARALKLSRIRSSSNIKASSGVQGATKSASEEEKARALSNLYGKSVSSPDVSNALATIRAKSELIDTAAQKEIAGIRSIQNAALGDQVNPAFPQTDPDLARIQRKINFNESENAFEGSGGYRTFNAFDRPTIDVHTPIPIRLSQPIDTRTPGPVNAIVIRDVYDTTGENLVLPKGTKVAGKYNTEIDYGNPKVQTVWQRFSFPKQYCQRVFGPEQTSCNMPIGSIAADRQGYAGISGKYDQRILSTFGYAVMFSVITALPSWLIDQIKPDGEEKVEDDIICISETTASDDEVIGDEVVDDGDTETDSETSTSTTRSSSSTTTERCGPRSVLGGGSGVVVNNNSNTSNTDTRDLYEEIARDAYDRTNDRMDKVFDGIASRKPYVMIPAGVGLVIYPADDFVFPKGKYKNNVATTAPWHKEKVY